MPGYNYEGGGVETSLLMSFSHTPPSSLPQARADWQTAVFSLPMPLRQYVVDPQVEPGNSLIASKQAPTNGIYSANGVDGTEVDTIETKKQRALQLLQDQGLTGALNGLA
jgi:hypothetical protein